MNFFFLAQFILKTFNRRLITVRDGWAHSGINHWPREFFQNAGSQTWLGPYMNFYLLVVTLLNWGVVY